MRVLYALSNLPNGALLNEEDSVDSLIDMKHLAHEESLPAIRFYGYENMIPLRVDTVPSERPEFSRDFFKVSFTPPATGANPLLPLSLLSRVETVQRTFEGAKLVRISQRGRSRGRSSFIT